MSSAGSDSDEFYDATEEGEDVTSPLRRKTSAQKQKSALPVLTAYEQQLKQLEKERQEAEERRKKEDEALKAQIQELEDKKHLEEEKERLRLLEEQKKREREREEEERRRQEEEEREREQQEAELRRQEAEKRRRRLEQMRRREEGDESSDVEETKRTIHSSVSESTDISHQSLSTVEEQEPSSSVEDREPGLANRNVEPDVIAMTKTKDRPSELPVPVATPSVDMPPPVAPPRRKKKKKPAEVKPLETQQTQQQPQQQPVQQQQQQQVSTQESDKLLEDSAEKPVGLPPEFMTQTPSGGRPHSGLLTPTTTIESITKELEHTLDLASLVTSGDHGNVVLHRDTQSIKGESRADIEAHLAAEASGERVSKSRGNTPDADKLLSYYNLMQGMSDKGEKLTDEEVLTQVLVKNLDTGETVPLLEAEERLPTCINPLNLHIMRLTSEYVSNSSLEKEAGGGSDGEKDATAVVQHQIKKKKKKLKKFLGKTVRKIRDAAEEAFQHEEDFSDDESLPDSRVMKIKAASSNKGPYDFDQLKLAQELTGEHTGAVWTMKFSSCGRLLATAGQDHILRVWVLKEHYKYFDDMRQKYNNETTQQQQQPPIPTTIPEMQSAETPSTEGVDTESVDSGATSVDSDEPNVFAKTPFCLYRGHTSDLLDVSWSKNYFILSSSMDKTVRLWHVSRNECLCCFQHIDFVTAIAFHPRDDRYFLSGSLDGKLRLWNIPDKKVALWNEIDGPTKLITAANFIQNGRFAVVGTYDGRCIFYDTEHLKYYSQIHVRSTRGRNAKGRKVTAIEPLPHQDKILVTSNDSRIRLYDLRDLSLACKYKGCTNISSQIKASFSHNHRYIICGSEDHCIYIWKKDYDFAKFTSVRRDRNDYWEAVKAHDAVVTVAVCSPNPSLIIKPTVAPAGPAKESPLEIAIKKDKMDQKLSEASKLERKSSLKRVLNQGEVIVSGDFNGTIKIFVNRPKV